MSYILGEVHLTNKGTGKTTTDRFDFSVEKAELNYYLDLPDVLEVSSLTPTEIQFEFKLYNFSDLKLNLANASKDLYLNRNYIVSNPNAGGEKVAIFQITDSDGNIVAEEVRPILILEPEFVQTFEVALGQNNFLIENSNDFNGVEIAFENNDSQLKELQLFTESTRDDKIRLILNSDIDKSMPFNIRGIPIDKYFVSLTPAKLRTHFM